MKNYNEKIEKFLKWLKEGENGDFRFIIPNRDAFELYKMENPEVTDLTDEEGKYLDILYKVTLVNGAATNRIKADISKIALSTDFGYSDRNIKKDDSPIEFVSFDTSGLLTDETVNHNNESLENEAIKEGQK